MAQFRATIQGTRGQASRLGTKKSGLLLNVNGWHAGISISASYEDGKDIFKVYKTAGSNGGHSSIHIATVRDGVIEDLPSGA